MYRSSVKRPQFGSPIPAGVCCFLAPKGKAMEHDAQRTEGSGCWVDLGGQEFDKLGFLLCVEHPAIIAQGLGQVGPLEALRSALAVLRWSAISSRRCWIRSSANSHCLVCENGRRPAPAQGQQQGCGQTFQEAGLRRSAPSEGGAELFASNPHAHLS